MALAEVSALMQDHDADLVGAAARLRAIAPSALEADDLASYSWLVNHVIGEKGHDWPGARALLEALPALAGEPPVVLRNRAVAFAMSGAALQAWQAESELAQALACGPALAATAVRLGALQHLAGTTDPLLVAATLVPCVHSIESAPAGGPVLTMAARAINNAVSGWLEHPQPATTDPLVAAAMSRAARCCKTVWQHAGTWLQVERADYLIALVANALADWEAAAHAARDGIRMIEANGGEDVDRAFLLLELARARHGMGEVEAARTARDASFALAERFDEPGLREWFDRKAGTLPVLSSVPSSTRPSARAA
jgi:hypothetical protein